MASLVLGVAGAAVGGLFGQASLGYMIGAALGGMFTNKPNLDTSYEGPRINDLKVTSSTYGAPIPITYGAIRIAGNMIWSTGLIETKHVTTQSSGGGGKGGGGGSATQTTITYTYSSSFAVAICEGVIQGIRRIWADGTLIYNLGVTADPAAVFQSNSISSTNKIYFGDQVQGPDPLMESYLGVGNVPGYRGIAYIVFDNLQLANYGNRIPNLEFEVLNEAVITGARVLVTNSNTGVQFDTDPTTGVGRPAALSFDGTVRVTAVNNGTVYVYDYNGNFVGTDSRASNEQYPGLNDQFGSSYPIGILNGYSVALTNLGSPMNEGMSLPAYVPGVYMSGFDNGISCDLASAIPNGGEYVGGAAISTDQTNIIVFTSPTNPVVGSNTINKYYIIEYGGGLPTLVQSGTLATALAISDLGFGNNSEYGFISCCLEDNLQWFWTQQGAQTHTASIYNIEGNVMTLVDHVDNVWPNSSMFAYPTIFAKSGVAWAFGGNQVAVITRVQSATVTNATLSSVITDLVTRGALTAADIDVTLLTNQVEGYFIGKPMTIRDAITPLQSAYWFDATETSGKLKFIPRGGSSIATITEDQLAAYDYTSSQLPDPINTIRTQELELPRQVQVTYMDLNADYQQAEQYASRLITPSQQVTQQQLPMSLQASEAVNIATVLLYNAWMERNTRTITVNMEYVYLDPCDIITITTSQATYNVRVVQTDYGQNGIVKIKTVDENAAVYNPNAVSSASQSTAQTVTMPGPTRLALLDMPILRDQDNNPGFYWAAAGYLGSWPGAALFRSTDGGATYNNAGSTVTPAVIGYATTVLGNWTGGNVFDEYNTVTVQLVSGELSSDTSDNVLNDSNVAMIGSELIQFKNATLIGTNLYTLSGLLRGRRGTEWAMNTHAVNETFVLADVLAWQRYVPNLSELNLARTWKAATIGLTIAEAIPYTFADTGIGLKCFSPVLIGGGRDASGNITIFWSRRGRIGGAWMDNIEVPLGEASENYSVDIMNGSTVVRTINAVTPTITYTAAQQTTDFGHLVNPVTINVYQLSGSVGRGYPGAATI